MIPQQLWRISMTGSVVSADQQTATPDENGSYGELMDAIDQVLEDTGSKPRRRSRPRRRKTKSSRR